jgi:hypothetical protein
MSFATKLGTAVHGQLLREPRANLGTKFGLSYYLFFLTGTSTAVAPFQNGALTTPFSSNQITSDANGRFPAIYLDGSVIYKVQFYNSLGALLHTLDPYTPQLSIQGLSTNVTYGPQIAATGEMTLPAPNSGGSGITLTLNAGALGTTPLKVTANAPGQPAIIINSSATTGAQTATFAAANKPGTATSSPAGWLPIQCDGTLYYTPIWHGNNFTPYTAPPNPIQSQSITGSGSAGHGGGGSVTWNPNGTLNGNFTGSVNSSNWYVPTTTGIGSSYWLQMTATSGTITGITSGAWTSMASAIGPVGSAFIGTVSGSWAISTNATGNPVVGGGSFSLGTSL